MQHVRPLVFDPGGQLFDVQQRREAFFANCPLQPVRSARIDSLVQGAACRNHGSAVAASNQVLGQFGCNEL